MLKKVLLICNIFLVLCSFSYKLCADEYAEDDLLESDIENITQASAVVESELKVNSKIAVAYDRASRRIIWGKDENKRTAMASTTKIMTAIVVIENSNLDDMVVVSQKSANTGGSRLGLKKDDKISVRDLLYGLMLRSGNDAAVALAEQVGGSVEGFSDMMNEKADSLLLRDTHFVTPHGLDNPSHYTTAFELAKIADYALKNEIFSQIVCTKNYTISINGYAKNINNTNELLGVVPGVYGVKTGFTNNAGRCLVTSVKNGDIDIITVVIQADNKKDRTTDSVKIINYVLKNYRKIDLEKYVTNLFNNWYDENKKRINITKARDKNIMLDMDEIEKKEILLNQGEIDSIEVKFNCIYNFEAPLESGKKIGEIKVYLNNNILETKSIYIKEEIHKKTFFDYFYECIKSIC